MLKVRQVPDLARKGCGSQGRDVTNPSVTDADTTAATQAERLAGPVDGSEMRQR